MTSEGKRAFGVVGNPIKHSISPRIHHFWHDQLGLDAAYVPLELSDASPVADLRALARVGFSGLNITLPYKAEALKAAEDQSDLAVKLGAANTLTRTDELSGAPVWSAENTDITGFLWSFEQKKKPETDEIVLIGAGGAARAVAAGLASEGYKLIILNRTLETAEEMIEALELPKARAFPLETLDDFAAVNSVVVNTISLGHGGGALELPRNKGALFIDISYGAAAEETLSNASLSGWEILDGLPMLVGQAADAFKIWFDIEPDRMAALKASRQWTKTRETLEAAEP